MDTEYKLGTQNTYDDLGSSWTPGVSHDHIHSLFLSVRVPVTRILVAYLEDDLCNWAHG